MSGKAMTIYLNAERLAGLGDDPRSAIYLLIDGMLDARKALARQADDTMAAAPSIIGVWQCTSCGSGNHGGYRCKNCMRPRP